MDREQVETTLHSCTFSNLAKIPFAYPVLLQIKFWLPT